MHRPAQRDLGAHPTPFRQWGKDRHDHSDQSGRGERQPDRRGPRLGRLLACAVAVPAVLVAGCSSHSGSGSAGGAKPQGKESSAKPSQRASANTTQPAGYSTLPKPCAVLPQKTLGDLVPKGKSGKEGSPDASGTRSSCSWSSLENNGVKGSQFRWLSISLLRFEPDATGGDGNQLAQRYFNRQVRDAQTVQGAKDTKSQPVAAMGDQATAVRYGLKKKEGDFKQDTVVARVKNVVVTLDYNGAGLAGDQAPNADALAKAAQNATGEAVTAVSAANNDGGKTGGSASQGASKSASPSKPASGSPSKSVSPPTSASGSASATKG